MRRVATEPKNMREPIGVSGLARLSDHEKKLAELLQTRRYETAAHLKQDFMAATGGGPKEYSKAMGNLKFEDVDPFVAIHEEMRYPLPVNTNIRLLTSRVGGRTLHQRLLARLASKTPVDINTLAKEHNLSLRTTQKAFEQMKAHFMGDGLHFKGLQTRD